MEQNVNVIGKFELDLYLAKTPLEPKIFSKLDIYAIGKIINYVIQTFVD